MKSSSGVEVPSLSTVVIGLGNPLLADDAVGIAVVKRLQPDLPAEVTAVEASVGGMQLVEFMLDHSKVILIDAVMTEGGRPGEIVRLAPDGIAETMNMGSLHDMGFQEALELWRKLAPQRVPGKIVIFAVQARDATTFSESMSPDVDRAVPKVVRLVLEELRRD